MPEGLIERLAAESIYVAPRLGRLRISPHVYNDEADIDRFIQAFRRLARVAAAMPRPSRSNLGLLVVGLGTVVAPLDTAVNIAFPSITRAFALEVEDIRWVVIAYVLTYASLMLVFGKLGDLLGYRRIFQLGLLVSAAGFAACSLAPTYRAPAARPHAAGDRHRPDAELCPGACHLAVRRARAHARARRLCRHHRGRLGPRSPGRRLSGRALGLECRVLVSRAAGAGGSGAVGPHSHSTQARLGARVRRRRRRPARRLDERAAARLLRACGALRHRPPARPGAAGARRSSSHS